MARQVVWTESAWQDLEEIADFIARDSKYYAAAFVQEVKNASRTLRRFADRGRVVPELGEPAVKEIFVGNYRLLYKLLSKKVVILAFIHGARDLTSLWWREERGII